MSSTLSLASLFSGRIFRVPDYQRGYAWDARQIDDLIEDLELLQEGREHYSGTIVLHSKGGEQLVDDGGASYGLLEVVDGQQRLATLVILIDCIRREFETLDGTLAQGIRRNYVAGKQLKGLPLFKLQLNSDCDHFFRECVLADIPGPEGPQISSERRLAEAKRRLSAYLTKQRQAQGDAFGEWLQSYYLKLTTRVAVSLYVVDTETDVGIIFELMNNRGKPLTELEKVKNYLLYAGSTIGEAEEISKTINAAWSEILRQLMAAGLTSAEDEDALLRAHWLTWYDPRPRLFEGSRSVKDHLDVRSYRERPADLLKDLAQYAETLRAAALCMCDARAPERTEAFQAFPERSRETVRRWSAKLTRMNVVAPFLPLLIGMRIRHPDNADGYVEVVQLCEKFAMRVHRLAGRRTDAGQKELIPLGFNVRAGQVVNVKTVLGEIVSAINQYAPKKTFETDLAAGVNWYDWAGLKYFLYEYEEHLAGRKNTTPKVRWAEVRDKDRADTIEHVLPQTMTDWWRERFSGPTFWLNVHDLGNLSLTRDNASYRNHTFPEKKGTPGSGKPCYADSPFFIERELALEDDWTPDLIKRRRERLVTWALDRWGLGDGEVKGPTVIEPSDPDDGGSNEVSFEPSNGEGQ